MGDPDLHHLLLICAYRDNEVDDSHPFSALIEELRANQVAVSSITLGNLRRHDVTALLAERGDDLSRQERERLSALIRGAKREGR